MSSPSRIGGSVREGTRVVLREITASLHNSPPMQPPYSKSGNDNSLQKIAEHEVKVRFAREFADVGSINYSTPESLSSASSFHSLSSSLSTKSSSGTCPDTVPQSSNQVTDTSYTSSIPGVEDLILGCANIHLNGEEDQSLNELQTTHDLSQDQTFTSATEGADLTGDIINDISLAGSENALPVIEDDSFEQHSPINHPNDIEERPILIVPNAVVIEEPLERSVSPDRSNDLSSSLQTCSLTNVEEFSLPFSSATISNLDSTVCLSTVRESPAVSKPETYTVAENTRLETQPLTLNVIPCSTIDSITSVSTLLEHAEGPSLPSISTVSLVNLTDSVKLNDGDSHGVEDNVKSSLARSSSPLNDINEVVSTSSQNVLKSPGQEIENTHRSQAETVSLSFNNATSGNENRTNLLNNTTFPIPNTLGIEEHLESTVYKETECNNASNSNLELSSNIESLKVDVSPVVTKEVDVVEETDAINAVTETEIREEKEEDLSDEKLDRTLTFDDNSLNLESEQEVEQYSKFKPQRQSTTLAIPVEQPNFNELKSAADQVADDIFRTTLEFSEETDNFISATADIFQDPTDFDFLVTHGNTKHINRLRTESLYVKFDPLVSDTSMLPQGNSPPINEEQNGKTENTPPNIDTPKRNPAIAAIDRLLFYSPLSTSMTQKTEEPREKIEQATEEPKSETPLVNDIDMSKELELVRTTVLQLEEELKKQKKEYEAELERQKKEYESELERQKNFFQESINKLQAQIAQEVKSKSQMTVVVEEYEKSISRLLTERERDRTNFEQEKVKLQEELQITNFHLANTEDAFNDVHQKYEKLKGVVSTYKNNEIVLKESIQENMETIKTLETRYDHLKNHAMTQLEKANLELDAMRKQHEDETVKLHAMLRKAELKSNSLAELVEQKTKENKELAQILDEVIARVGHQNADE
ncbi:calponin homology domain-containing protein DDB_G0272472 isoform X1 [Colletes gigas]|uniref:calponin homology domain-containing protein DDB_G0272472 isoform X1 n=1 Tax=Colletes gigas TaxID=935657 RepID=UPI001C9B0303|nr:calponin homology domain-containing protein DDB_G0272472 isoform X1 [Colletes gigas]